MKRGLVLSVIFISLILLSLSLVSASVFSDFFSKITGKVTSASCWDRDGINYYVENYVSVTYANGSTRDAADYCIDSTNLIEITCKSDGSDILPIGYTCPNGCSGNKCKGPGCMDFDGDDKTVESYAISYDYNNKQIDTKSDYCIDSTNLIEITCSGNSILPKSYVCSGGGCLSGVCVSSTSTCSDSDGGKDYTTKGTVSGTGITSSTDTCSGSVLTEYYCEGNSKNSESKTCDYGCSDGKCLSSPTITSTCLDHDGIDYYVQGWTDITYSNNTVKESQTDYCIAGTNNLVEMTCNSDGSDILEVSYTCSNLCANGKCDQPGCMDYDGDDPAVSSWVRRYKGGGITDYNEESDSCTNSTYLIERICDSDEEIAQKSYICSGGCSDGVCLSSAPESETCTDTDGGKNYYIKGEIYVNGEYHNEDKCNTQNNDLNEWYCDSTIQNVESYTCPYGCSNGACQVNSDTGFVCSPVVEPGPNIAPKTRVEINGNLSYCDPFTLTYIQVKADNSTCTNDYECDSNICVDSKCTSLSSKLSILQEIFCWLKDTFGDTDYDTCIASYQ